MKKVLDNFLSKEDHQKIIDIFKDINWFYNKNVVYDGEEDPNLYAMVTCIYQYGQNYNREVTNIFTKYINPYNWTRIKANFSPKRDIFLENALHIDMVTTLPDQWTSVYYINSNNGYTYFEDGEKVSSVANRMVIFPVNTMHSGTTSTDDHRLVINFNWFGSVAE